MTTAAPDLTIAERETRARLEDLCRRRQQLTPEARGSQKAAAELATVEEELAGQELELERIVLAQQELSRRDQEAAVAAAAERRAQALARARDLAERRLKAAKAIDAALARFARALADHHQASLEQSRALVAAGGGGTFDSPASRALPMEGMIHQAIARAFLDADVPQGVLDIKHRRLDSQPLAETDPGLALVEEVEAAR